MKRESPGLLERIYAARTSSWIAAMAGKPQQDTLDEILDPGLKQIRRLTDEEIAQVIAREPNSEMGHLAARVMRERESWRTPARWALLVSLLSFALALIAFVRTF
jgi:hypothetical protein